jgi:hypothetical protein
LVGAGRSTAPLILREAGGGRQHEHGGNRPGGPGRAPPSGAGVGESQVASQTSNLVPDAAVMSPQAAGTNASVPGLFHLHQIIKYDRVHHNQAEAHAHPIQIQARTRSTARQVYPEPIPTPTDPLPCITTETTFALHHRPYHTRSCRESQRGSPGPRNPTAGVGACPTDKLLIVD